MAHRGTRAIALFPLDWHSKRRRGRSHAGKRFALLVYQRIRNYGYGNFGEMLVPALRTYNRDSRLIWLKLFARHSMRCLFSPNSERNQSRPRRRNCSGSYPSRSTGRWLHFPQGGFRDGSGAVATVVASSPVQQAIERLDERDARTVIDATAGLRGGNGRAIEPDEFCRRREAL